jgi:hypothetical protein
MDKNLMTGLLFLVLSILVVFYGRKETNHYLKGNFLNHSNLFLLGYTIVFFQYYIDYVLGNVSDSEMRIWVDKTIVVKSMVLAIVGMLCFMIGYLSYKGRVVNEDTKTNYTYVSVNLLVYINLFSLILFYTTVNPLYLLGHYGVESMGSTATYASLIFEITYFAIVIQFSRNSIESNFQPTSFWQYVKKYPSLFMLSSVVYLTGVLISGDRGPLMTFSIAFYGSYFFVANRKLKLRLGLIIVFLGAFFINLLGIVRSLDKEKSFKDRIQQALTEDKQTTPTFSKTTQELAGSVRTFHTTVDYIPAKHEFLYGRFQVQHIVLTFPFVNEFLQEFYADNHRKYAGSSSFVTWVIQGEKPNSGDGTNCLSDFYFDFGVVGMVAGMLIFGYIIRVFEFNLLSKQLHLSLFIHVAALYYLSKSFYLPRSALLFDIRQIVWIFALLYVNSSFHLKYKR